MVIKEKKLAILIYLLRYGRMTSDECYSCLGLHSSRQRKEWDKLCEIPGVYRDKNRSILFSMFYIISHRIPEFYDHEGKLILLRDVKTKSPVSRMINYNSNETLREAFA